MTGIHTIADLRDRCRIDDITGCWHWAGALDGKGCGSLWLPALRRRVSLGLAICVLKTGCHPAEGVVWHTVCGTRDCANPEHRRAGDRSSQMLAAKIKRTPLQRARIAAGRRQGSRLTEQGAQEIRDSDEPLRVLAERHGISVAHACNVRNGRQRCHLAAPGSSVFNLGGDHG